jgi:hypothetical protein
MRDGSGFRRGQAPLYPVNKREKYRIHVSCKDWSEELRKPYMLRGKDTHCCILLGKRQELLDPVREDGAGILVSCEEGGQESLYPVMNHGIGIPCIM